MKKELTKVHNWRKADSLGSVFNSRAGLAFDLTHNCWVILRAKLELPNGQGGERQGTAVISITDSFGSSYKMYIEDED